MSKNKLIGDYLLLSCFMIFVVVAGCGGPKSIMVLPQQQQYSIDQVPDSLKEDADIITRHYTRNIEILNRASAIVTVRFAVTVLNMDGRKYGQLVLPYDQFRSVEYAHGTLRDRDGRVIRVMEEDEESDFKATNSISLYDDNRVKVFELYHSSYPYTFEFEYQVWHNGMTDFSNMPIQQYREGVEHAEFNIQYPSNMELDYLVENGDPEIRELSTGDQKELQIVFENLSPREQEQLGPPNSTYLPHLSVTPDHFKIEDIQGSFTSWESFGKWYYELSKGKRELPDNIKREVDVLIAGIEDDSTKLNALYNYMQDKTRYVSIQLGIGGWEPFDAYYVAENEYGDCKALTNFMMAIAGYAGIETYPVLINSGSNSRFDVNPNFPSNSFNHIVLMAPMEEDTLWMESTSKTMIFGDIGLSNEDRYALVVTPEGGKLVKTPAKAYTQNQQLNTAEITIQDNGVAEGSIKTVFTGGQQQYMRQNVFMSNDRERMRWLKNSLNLNNVKLDDVSFADPGKRSNRYQITYRIEAPKFATETGNRLFIPVNAFNKWNLQLQGNKERETDLYLPFTFADRDSSILKLPQGYRIESIPEFPKIDSEYIDYEAELEIKDLRTLVYKRKIGLKKSTIPKEDYYLVKDFFAKIYNADRQKLVVNKNN